MIFSYKEKKMKMISIIGLMFTFFFFAKAEEVNFDSEKNVEFKNIINMREVLTIQEPKISDKILDTQRSNINKSVDYAILNTIKRCEENNVSYNIIDGLKKLFIYGSSEERSEFLKGHTYYIPSHIQRLPSVDITSFLNEIGNGNKGTRICEQVCVEWGTKQVCIDKNVCDNVCDGSTLVCLVWDPNKLHCAVWGPACHIVCRIISDCHNVPVCKKTEEMCPPNL
jgi:hypothetical protein